MRILAREGERVSAEAMAAALLTGIASGVLGARLAAQASDGAVPVEMRQLG